ncbi:phage tail spike protein [Cohnella herbarum]|uniref:Prophage tail endopeptidase domain-containing protein n=1 Tax=Cohnella herbarum TaxID=2728023 RepID=A0A7Z2VIQ5_9BACL|nr:phage tail spike protein [Cohnella herbarum]QJD83996.1 hypothetical protein HH215_12925 [Cohnella herbarum]
MNNKFQFENGIINEVKLYLCRPSDRATITELYHIKDRNLTINYGGVNELSFSVPYAILDENNDTVRNPLVDQIYGDFIVRYEYKQQQEYYIITNPEYVMDSSGNEQLNILCYQQHYEWKNKLVRALKGTYKLYDPAGANGVLNKTLLTQTDWTVDYIDSSLLSKHRTFDTSETNLLEFIFSAIETYGSYIPFIDTVNKRLSVYLDENYGRDEGLRIEYGHYLKSLKETDKFDEVVTRLYIYGNDELSIYGLNPTGTSYLENYSFYMYGYAEDTQGNVIGHSKFMSDSLCKALRSYEKLLQSKAAVFSGYLSTLSGHQSTLAVKKNELYGLQNERRTLLDLKDVLIGTGGDVTSVNGQIEFKQTQIDDKTTEITDVNLSITAVNNQIATLKSQLSESANFTTSQIKEKQFFTKEKTWQESNITKAEDLLEQGGKNLQLWSQPNIAYECDIIDIIAALNVPYDKEKLKIGTVITIYYPRFNIDIKAKVITIDHDIDGNGLKVTIANTKDIKSGFLKIKDLLQRSNTTSTTVDMSKHKWDLSTENNTQINDILNEAWDANKRAIEAGDNQNYSLNERGLTLKSPTDPFNYLRGLHNIIGFTNDGGNTWKNALTPNGLVAEVIKGKLGAFATIATDQILIGSTLIGDGLINSSGAWNTAATQAGNSVQKNTFYNGVKIDSASGLVITRSDNRSRSVFNATDGIKIQSSTDGVNWVDRLSANSTGDITLTGALTTGTGASAVRVDTNGLYIGSSTFSSAPVRITPAGDAIFAGTIQASKVNLTGGKMNINNTFIVDELGNATVSGNVTANAIAANTYISAPNIVGGTINIGNSNFTVGTDGTVNANNGTFRGSINATSGTFSGNISSTATISGGILKGATIEGGNISVATDVEIGNNLYIGTKDNASGKRIWFTTGSGSAVISYDRTNNQINLSAQNGVKIDSGNLMINGYRAVTTYDLDSHVAKWG